MKIFRTTILLTSAVVLLTGTSTSEEKLTLTVDRAIAIGIENSKSLHASLKKVEAADARSSEVAAQGLPSLKFNGTYTRLSEVDPFIITTPFGTFPIAPGIFDNYTLKATVQQPLFTGFKISSSEAIAEYSSQATKLDHTKDTKEITFAIQQAYWNLYKANEFKKVTDENVEQIRAHVKDAENLLAQGMATTNDVLKVQVQLSDALVRQIDACNSVRLSMIALNNTLSIPLSTEIELTADVVHTPRNYSEIDQLVKTALGSRSEIQAMNARLKASEAGITLARSGWYPQVALIADYNYARPNPRIVPAKDAFKDTWDVNVAVSFDIWNWNTTSHQTTQAQAQLAQTEDASSQLRDAITLEVTQNFLNQQQAEERIGVAEQGVRQSEENYRITNEKFKKGLALNSDLLDAEVALLQSKWNLIQAKVDYELAEARLRKALGE